MTDHVVLLLCEEPGIAESLAEPLKRGASATVLTCANLEDVIESGGLDEFALILVYLSKPRDRETVDLLLWSLSLGRRSVPLIVLRDRYDAAEALTLFRMGVADYLSLSDHRQNLPAVIQTLLSPPGLIVGGDAFDQPFLERHPEHAPALSNIS